ncbi:AraC family transcriptional regulator [Actinomadura sp. WMMB 499]|uniref:helix-turn-helix domain-containing protein n=1 Tax=Actinomadura sp. WMMB 499 TaxID=1219491 RepID=UPI0012489519|nr:helix-turn-helix domain-containing protein [Actinomadura sp. WMMB 499]QFG26577.1 helix-turn-helix transcriptional regulator [Actinomadura sp. WMMB 499]
MSERPVAFSDRDGWWLARGRPHPALRPFLRSYDGYWEEPARPSRMRTLPTRTAVLIINLGPPMLLRTPDPDGDRVYRSFVAGMHAGPGMYEHPGGQVGVQLDITPLGAYTLFGVPMARLSNLAVELPDLLGPGAAALVDRLAGTPGWGDRFDLIDAYLLRRADAGPVPDPEVRRAWDLLLRSGGTTGVAELAADVGWSRKHLAHRFREQAGLPPKVMGRVLRFQRAVGLLARGGDLAATAFACGYYDQAHLNREFRTLAGCTPTEVLNGGAEPQLLTTGAEPP